MRHGQERTISLHAGRPTYVYSGNHAWATLSIYTELRRRRKEYWTYMELDIGVSIYARIINRRWP